MVNEKQVWDQLSKVIDPELDINIVDLGLIYEVKVVTSNTNTRIYVIMTLTTPGCPLAGVINKMIKEAIAQIEGVEETDIEIELVWDPPWTQEMMLEEAKLRLGFV